MGDRFQDRSEQRQDEARRRMDREQDKPPERGRRDEEPPERGRDLDEDTLEQQWGRGENPF